MASRGTPKIRSRAAKLKAIAAKLVRSQAALWKSGLENLAGNRRQVVSNPLDMVFGLRPLEDVFDQQVATVLQRLGVPTAAQLRELAEQVDRLEATVDELRRRAPRKRR